MCFKEKLLLFLVAGFFLLACFSFFWAYVNLLGVPMQESTSMDPTQGWISVWVCAFSVITNVASYLVWRKFYKK